MKLYYLAGSCALAPQSTPMVECGVCLPRWWPRRDEPANSIYVAPCFLSFFTRCF
jgi:hypothetical protein